MSPPVVVLVFPVELQHIKEVAAKDREDVVEADVLINNEVNVRLGKRKTLKFGTFVSTLHHSERRMRRIDPNNNDCY
jgi:hypothetical protein